MLGMWGLWDMGAGDVGAAWPSDSCAAATAGVLPWVCAAPSTAPSQDNLSEAQAPFQEARYVVLIIHNLWKAQGRGMPVGEVLEVGLGN